MQSIEAKYRIESYIVYVENVYVILLLFNSNEIERRKEE